MKKSIAIVITRLDLGGAQKVALYLAAHLDRAKYNVHLITGTGGYLDDEARQIENISLKFMKELKHPISPLNDFVAIMKLSSYFKKNKIDIVHTHSSKAGLIGRLAAKLAGVKFITHTIHGFSFHEYQNPSMYFLYVMLERMAAAWCDKLVAVGDDVVEYGLKNKVGSAKKYTVIRAGVDISLFANAKPDRAEYLEKYGLNKDHFTVGMIGNLKKQKNPVGFVETAREVLAVDEDVQFIFAGDGPLRTKVEKLVKLYKIGHKVKFTGWIDDPHKFVKSLDVFLLTSFWEGLPCTLAQAASAGIPCVATNIYGNREILKDLELGMLYEPFNYKEAAEKIIVFKNMERKEGKYGRAHKEILDEFDQEAMLKKHEELYSKG